MTRRVLGAFLLALLIAGCGEGPGFGYTIAARNDTGIRLHFALTRSDGTVQSLALSDTAPGAQTVLISGSLLSDSGIVLNWCTVGDVIAYGPDNQVVGRRSPQLCADKQDLWIVTNAQFHWLRLREPALSPRDIPQP